MRCCRLEKIIVGNPGIRRVLTLEYRYLTLFSKRNWPHYQYVYSPYISHGADEENSCNNQGFFFNYVTISTIWSDVTVRLIKQCFFLALFCLFDKEND